MLSPRSALHADKLQGVRAPIARSKNMEELDELRQAIEAGDYDQALAILDELDAISRDDKITKMMSYMRVLEAVRKLMSNKSIPYKSLKVWQETDCPVSPFLALPRI
jgi:hypothetical protein